jgi:RNA polymerase sigma-70 factor, ECF subfamily
MLETGDVQRTAEAVARASYGKLVAFLAARTRNVAGAEDALSDAFAAALADWPKSGLPENPEAWLMAAAWRKLIDASRRAKTRDDAAGELTLLAEERAGAWPSAEIPDNRLQLMFACANPAIDAGVRAPLILQTILGFDAAEIASAFLVSPSAMAQRLVRAKSKIQEAGIPFRIPERAEMPERLDAVLAAIYAAFAAGWPDAAGTDTRLCNLAEEAIWLGRLVASLLPDEPEALGLVALMLHAEARRAARRQGGEFIPLTEQDTALWGEALIGEAERLLLRASALGAPGRYQLEAAVQSAHANRRKTGHTDWLAIRGLYEALIALTESNVVAINLAVAISETDSAEAGFAALDAVSVDARLADYQPYWAARAELLSRCGDAAGARQAYDRAIGLETDPAVRRFLQRRRDALR